MLAFRGLRWILRGLVVSILKAFGIESCCVSEKGSDRLSISYVVIQDTKSKPSIDGIAQNCVCSPYG